MKKRLMTTGLFLALASTSAFAHHPAADIVDPEIYAMIDENVADTPHADLTFDDMGRPTDDVMGSEMGQSSEDMVADMDASETMDLIENVDPQLAQSSDDLVRD